MECSLYSGDLVSTYYDYLVLGVFQDEAPNDMLSTVNDALSGALFKLSESQNFKGKEGQILQCPVLSGKPLRHVCLMGLGKREKFSETKRLHSAGAAQRSGNAMGAKCVVIALDENIMTDSTLSLLVQGALLSRYKFETYLSEPSPKSSVEKMQFWVGNAALEDQAEAIRKGEVIAQATKVARDFVNDGPNSLYPESFAARAMKLAFEHGVQSRVYEKAELKEMKMNLLLGVGQGSAQAPRLLHLSYRPEGCEKKKPIILVGKGITFDSGGISLKPAASFIEWNMKTDMGGAASVLGAMLAVGALKPQVPVEGIMALAENMPSGTAIRPGDIITGAAGKSIEINNTDAEGRLVLADALHYAMSLNPAYVIDLATLTGACMVALGVHTTGMFCNDEAMAASLKESAESMGEDFWRLPLNEKLNEELKSDVADMKNTGSRMGGAITAALFLSHFVKEGVNWAHLDIAGPSTTNTDAGAYSKGGTGVGVSTLVDFILKHQA